MFVDGDIIQTILDAFFWDTLYVVGPLFRLPPFLGGPGGSRQGGTSNNGYILGSWYDILNQNGGKNKHKICA